MARAADKRANDKIKELTGASRMADWKIGTRVITTRLASGLYGKVTRGARKLHGEYVVDVLLESGRTLEEIPTKALKRLGFSIEDAQ